jgi:hypothetical protein
MRLARDEDLDQVEKLLVVLRGVDGITEKRRGVFYRGSAAFLHFHTDPAGMFADMRATDGWRRYPVRSAGQRRSMVADVRAALAGRPARGGESRTLSASPKGAVRNG